jgi:ABC-type sugar transport system ATPase subunit
MSTDNPSESTTASEEAAATAENAPVRDERTKIRVENVEKRFGRIVALDDVTLDIYDNEIFALVGDNGAGKSTLMNILSGVYAPSAGTVFYDGEPVQFSNPSDARSLGIETVYQDLALMNDLDVATNIFIGQLPTKGIGPLRYVDWDYVYDRAEAIIHDRLGREMDIRTDVEFLSGGQRQLVAIGRSLAFEPEVIILDEPTSALSVDATGLVHDTIRRLRDDGHTILIVSHSIEDVLGLADRIGVLYRGELVELTEPSETSLAELTELITSGPLPGDEAE